MKLSGIEQLASGAAIDPPGGAQLCSGYLQSHMHLLRLKETVTSGTGTVRSWQMSCSQKVTIQIYTGDGLQDLNPGSFDELLLEDSRDFLAQACLRIYTGKNAPQPDVMLKVEDDKLPAHRTLLAESSDVFEAMFQARSFLLCMLSHQLYII